MVFAAVAVVITEMSSLGRAGPSYAIIAAHPLRSTGKKNGKKRKDTVRMFRLFIGSSSTY
jgi:hypothetical protein